MLIEPGTATMNGFLRGGVRIKHIPSYYSLEQVSHWLSVIGYKPDLSADDLSTGKFVTSLKSLRTVQRLHLLTFRFENTAMHYTATHTVDVSPEGIFQRMVVDRKGSYCWGQHTLFLGMLRGLGFRAYGASARCNTAHPSVIIPTFTPLFHMLVLVQPGDDATTYLSDVGYGGSGLTRPMLLSDDESNVQLGSSPAEKHRLRRGALPHSSLEFVEGGNAGSGHWHLELSDDRVNHRWRLLYVFSEEEGFALDFESGSYSFSSQPGSAGGEFWKDVIAVKHFALSKEEVQEIAVQYPDVVIGDNIWTGKFTLGKGVVKRIVGKRIEVLSNLKCDLERVQVLRETFGIPLKDEDALYNLGRASELKIE